MARRRRPPRTVAQPMSYAQLLQLANDLVRGASTPEKQAIERERTRLDQRSRQQQAAISGYNGATADMLGENAQQFGQVVDQASGLSGALGAGYAAALKMGAGGTEGAVNADMAKIGAAPIESQAGNAADAVFGIASGIPGRSFAEEGAAMKTHALNMPGIARAQGRDQLSRHLYEVNEDDAELGSRLVDVDAKALASRPEILMKLLESERGYGLDVQENSRANTAANVNSNYIRAQTAALVAELTGSYDGKLTPKARAIIAEITGVDPVTGATVPSGNDDDPAEARADAVAAREDAFAKVPDTADLFIRQNLIGKKVPNPDYNPNRMGSEKEITVTPAWGASRKRLFDHLWPQLSRYASKSGKAKLQNRLYKLVDKALAAAGIERSATPTPLPQGD